MSDTLLKSDIESNCVFVISHYKRTCFSRDHVFIAQIKTGCALFCTQCSTINLHTMFVLRPRSVIVLCNTACVTVGVVGSPQIGTQNGPM